MNAKMRYRLAAQDQQARLDELSGKEIVGLADEISLTRYLIESAANANQFALVNSLLGTLAKLTNAHQIAMQRAGETMSRETLLELARCCVEIIAQEFTDVPGWEDRFERAVGRFNALADAVSRQGLAANWDDSLSTNDHARLRLKGWQQ